METVRSTYSQEALKGLRKEIQKGYAGNPSPLMPKKLKAWAVSSRRKKHSDNRIVMKIFDPTHPWEILKEIYIDGCELTINKAGTG